MTVRELILILEKHDPDTPLVFLSSDYDSSKWIDLEDPEVAFGKRCEKHFDTWNVYCKEGEPDVVKVLLLS